VSTDVSELAANKQRALEFFEIAFNQKRPEDAVRAFMGDPYIQHNPGADDGQENSIAAINGFVSQFPELSVEVKRVVAEDDLVAIHHHLRTSPEDRGIAALDIFRFRDGKIVEHWDVLQPVPEKPANDNTMF
jgi:predicted SnoaL-like aldol condensation-catalyzing enzyme